MENLNNSITVRLLFLLCLLLPFSSPLTAKTLKEVQEQLSSQSIVRGDFIQIRKMQMFKQPLSSQGVFTIARNKGLIWKQMTPFPVTLVLTDNKLKQQYGEQKGKVISAEENPMAFYFSRMFLELFQGDASGLQESFNVNFSSDGNLWTLNLIPEKAPLSSVFASIKITGQEYIDSIELTELRGDITAINFSGQSLVPEHLSHDEESAFQF